jgi:uncharacterized membrane protein
MAKAQQSANGRASSGSGGPAAGTGKAARPAAARPGQPGRGAPARKPGPAPSGSAARNGSPARSGSTGRSGSAARSGSPAQARDAVRNGDTAPVPPGAPPAPRWLVVVTGVLALVGVALSVYLTITHLHPAALICSGTKHSIVNCAAVTQSAQSKVFGIFPVAELGLAFYVVMAVLCTPWAWRMRRVLRLGPVSVGDRELRWIRLVAIVAGMGFVLYLLFVELLQLKQICLYCTGVHITTFVLFVLIVFDSVFRQAPANSAAPVVAKRTKG